MAVRRCLNCVYVFCDLCEWSSCAVRGDPLVPKCANHPSCPGQLHDVSGIACRNYRPKPAEPNELDDTVRRIPLSNGQFTLVDTADYKWLSQYTWTLVAAGYAGRSEKGKLILMHRQIMQPPEDMVVDHIDGACLNNCRSNLRICTRAQNIRNTAKRRRAASQYKCVGYDKDRQKWFARFRHLDLHLWLGYFDDEAKAARTYDEKAVAYFGEFARLNFPEEWPPQRRQQVYADAQPLREALRAKAKRKQKAKANSRKAKGKGQKATTKAKSTARTKRTSRKSSAKTRRAATARKSKHTRTTAVERRSPSRRPAARRGTPGQRSRR